MIGVIHLIINLILLFSFHEKECGDSFFIDFCFYLSEINIEINVETICFLIFISILYAFEHCTKLLTMNDFTAFHLILIVIFGEIINDIFKLIINFNYIYLLIYVITYSFEILGVFVFMEAIEINICNLNTYLKKNKILRTGNEINLLYSYQNQSENESEESEANLTEDSNNNERNVIYE